MDPDTILKSLKLVWEAFSAEPIPFIAGLALVGMVSLFFTRSFYRQQIVTLTERRELAHDQAHAAQKAQKGLEAEIDSLQAKIGGFTEAVERDAAYREQPVSLGVALAASETEGAMDRLKKKESDFSATFDAILAARFAAWDDKYVLTGEDVKRIWDKNTRET